MRRWGWSAALLGFALLRWTPESAVAWLRCPFKGMSGWPCAACGSGRALRALARFDLATALEMNPLVVLLALGGLAYAGLSLVRATSTRWDAPPVRARWLILVAGAAVLANWAYLLAAGR